MGMLRVFAAVPLSVEVKRSLAAPLAQARLQAPDVKWVDISNAHITVKFFGDTAEERIGRLAQALQDVTSEFRSFSVSVCGIGAFPSLDRPRVVWAGVREGRDELCRLAHAVHVATSEAGFAPEAGQPFSPHVTLGRFRGREPGAAVPRVLKDSATRCRGTLGVNQVTLYSSTLRPTGPVYRVLSQATLKP